MNPEEKGPLTPGEGETGRSFEHLHDTSVDGSLQPSPLEHVKTGGGGDEHVEKLHRVLALGCKHEAEEDALKAKQRKERLALADELCLTDGDLKSRLWQAVEKVGPVMVNLADVQPEPVEWLWPGRIALGKLTLVVGDPGLGKSFLTLDLAARISRGTPWPDLRDEPNPSGSIIILSAEDDKADTIRPRLDSTGADVSRIAMLDAVRNYSRDGQRSCDKTFDLTNDIPALEIAIMRMPGCRLVIIDPITAYTGKVDSHKNAELRGLLAPLAQLAGKHRVAIVGVSHLNKAANLPAIYRIMGSLAWVAAARAAWAVIRDKNDGKRRLFVAVKNNVGPDGDGLAFRLDRLGNGSIPCVAWEPTPLTTTADAALSTDRRRGPRPTKTEAAMEWLRELLGGGPRSAKHVRDEAKAAGFAMRTVHVAKDELGITVTKSGFTDGCWWWRLPRTTEDAEMPADTENSASSGETLHLRGITEKNGNDATRLDPRSTEGAEFHECRPNSATFVGQPPSHDGKWDDVAHRCNGSRQLSVEERQQATIDALEASLRQKGNDEVGESPPADTVDSPTDEVTPGYDLDQAARQTIDDYGIPDLGG